MDPYGIDDNASVGSLAATDLESGRSGDNNDRDDDEDSDSPEAMVKRQTRSIAQIKFLLLSVMVVGGIFLAAAAFLTAEADSAGLKAGVVGGILLLELLLFVRYDYLVAKRNTMLLDMAQSSRAIVDQLFPGFARDRLLSQINASTHHGSSHHSDHPDDDPILAMQISGNKSVDWERLTKLNTLQNQRLAAEAAASGKSPLPLSSSKKAPTQIKTFLSSGSAGQFMVAGDSEPIAELYTDTTVLFADIAGFTAWSSDREPSQVFRLLERVYGAFDSMADKLKVFKVETIGDSYMCVTGLPEPDEQHAVNMARFAYQCLVKMQQVTDDLSTILGPGTEELDVRIGLHSGPVTAGVLRGQKSRFQLFGDTVNTASRMESTGTKGRIQVSDSTAKSLKAAGKAHWIQERMDRIVAKGKGELRTFWLEPRRRTESNDGIESGDDQTNVVSLQEGSMADKAAALRKSKLNLKDTRVPTTGEAITLSNMNRRLKSSFRMLTDERHSRLIEHNTDVLLKYVVAVIESRGPTPESPGGARSMRDVNHDAETHELPPPFESVADVILLPDFDARKMPPSAKKAMEGIDMDELRGEIRSFVAEIAALYQDVSFHNFEHASHVTLAIHKLLARMTASKDHTELELHVLTYGISSDPITQLSMVLAALVHDVGHSGITNAQLVAEEAPVALKYKEQSVAEQNSISVAWALLMHSRYKALRTHLYKTNVERKRFRQVLINAVMATDIADRDVIVARARRWKRAFPDEDEEGDLAAGGRQGAAYTRDERNRRATVVIETLMQVADVAHTMQHWNIYRKWNENLFQEMYAAYMNGRAAFDPTVIWFRGELAFLDHFVVPLAQKVEESGVFGPSGDQYLKYALSNRNEWEQKGHEELKGMIEDARLIEPDTTVDLSRMDSDMESFAPSRAPGHGNHLVPTAASNDVTSEYSGGSSTELGLGESSYLALVSQGCETNASSNFAPASQAFEETDVDSDIDSTTPVPEQKRLPPVSSLLAPTSPPKSPSKSARTSSQRTDSSPSSQSPTKPNRSPSPSAASLSKPPSGAFNGSPPPRRSPSPPPPSPGPPSEIAAKAAKPRKSRDSAAAAPPPATTAATTTTAASSSAAGSSSATTAEASNRGTGSTAVRALEVAVGDGVDDETFETHRVSL